METSFFKEKRKESSRTAEKDGTFCSFLKSPSGRKHTDQVDFVSFFMRKIAQLGRPFSLVEKDRFR